MQSRTRRTQLACGLALTGVVLAGCSGPAAPLDVGTQTAPIALVLGELKARDQAPVGPITQPPAPWTTPYYQPPAGLPVLPTAPPPPPLPCPDFDPLAPVLGVGRVVAAPPVKATYPYRASVVESYAGKTNVVNADSTWSISAGPVDATTGGYDVTYTVRLGKAVTTRVLRVLPRDVNPQGSDDPSDQTNPNAVIAQANEQLAGTGAPVLPTSMPNLAAYGLAGIYLVSETTGEGTFTPSVPMALLQLRQVNGATDPVAQNAAAITSVGVDPVSQAVMAFRSTVTIPDNKVNACGTKLEALHVTLSSPNSPDTMPPANPATQLTGPDFGAAFYAQKNSSKDPAHPTANVELFYEHIDFGLQYGGLVLADSVGVAPKGLLPGGLVLDPQDPPTVTPSGSPPSPDPADPAGTALGTGVWVATPLIAYAMEHQIGKTASFVINVKPKLPKAP